MEIESYLVDRNHHNTITDNSKTASPPRILSSLLGQYPEKAEAPEFSGVGDVALSETFSFFPDSDVEVFKMLVGIPVAEEDALS